MGRFYFNTSRGERIPALDEAEMREVDRIAVEEFQLGILQMMENAGRNLALYAMMEYLENPNARICILAGSGGNGGGGLCCARHLHNHGYAVDIILSKETPSLRGAAKTQMGILEAAGILPTSAKRASQSLASSELIIDALIGYSLKGPPQGEIKRLINLANTASAPVLSLDLPSGLQATSGETLGVAINATSTLTLALPKTGLRMYAGALVLADIGIPRELYQRLGLDIPPFPPGSIIQRLLLP
jgi:NAD(P)H-hydrate epimerase